MGEAKAKQKAAGQVFTVLASARDRFDLTTFLFRQVAIKGRVDRKLCRRVADALELREFRQRIIDDPPKLNGVTLTDDERVALRRSVALDPDELRAPARRFTLTVENVEFLDRVAETLDLSGAAVVGGVGELIDDLTDLKAAPPDDGSAVAVGSAAEEDAQDDAQDEEEEEEEDEDEESDEPEHAPANGSPAEVQARIE